MYDDNERVGREKLETARLVLKPVVTLASGQTRTLADIVVPEKGEYLSVPKTSATHSEHENDFKSWMQHQKEDSELHQFRTTGVHKFRVFCLSLEIEKYRKKNSFCCSAVLDFSAERCSFVESDGSVQGRQWRRGNCRTASHHLLFAAGHVRSPVHQHRPSQCRRVRHFPLEDQLHIRTVSLCGRLIIILATVASIKMFSSLYIAGLSPFSGHFQRGHCLQRSRNTGSCRSDDDFLYPRRQ